MTDKLMPTETDSLAMNLSNDGSGLTGLPGVPGSGQGGGIGASAGGKPAGKFSGQVVIAGVVIVLAAGAIYTMRFVGLNAGFGGESVKIDYTAQSGTPEMNRRFESVMGQLDASMSAVQIADSAALPATPFTRPDNSEPADTMVFEEPTSMSDLDRLSRLAEEERRVRLEARAGLLKNELARLQVQGIIGGRVPVARINGQPVTIGAMLGPFRVVTIERQSVLIEADGTTYELQIGLPPRVVE